MSDRLFELEDDRKPWQRSGLPDPSADRPPPVHARAHDTERIAAGLVRPRAGTLRELALATIAEHPEGVTHGELAELTGKRHYSIAPRVTELVEMGWVMDSHRRRPTDTGSPAIVWTLTPRAARWWSES